jgi:3-deoxy-manno-octulosonate cytidylyltransferase (CMP-KDO synthetase)
MVQHVWERARLSRSLDRVLVATDDERIVRAVRAFGGEAVLTSAAHATGTDRLAEAARRTDATIVVNVQGDEPMLDPAVIDAALAPFDGEPSVEMSTVSVPLRSVDEMLSPMVVKVVVDAKGDALYFSRSPIPFVRGGGEARAAAKAAVAQGLARRHLGLYAYRRATLERIAALPKAPLEEAESLEQLRALHYGIRIRVVPVEAEAGVAVDTAEDLERARALMAGGRG